MPLYRRWHISLGSVEGPLTMIYGMPLYRRCHISLGSVEGPLTMIYGMPLYRHWHISFPECSAIFDELHVIEFQYRNTTFTIEKNYNIIN